jgi:hypothetical protein
MGTLLSTLFLVYFSSGIEMTTRVVAVRDYSSPLFNQLACNRGEVLHVDWAKRFVPPSSSSFIAIENLLAGTIAILAQIIMMPLMVACAQLQALESERRERLTTKLFYTQTSKSPQHAGLALVQAQRAARLARGGRRPRAGQPPP